MSRKDRGFYCNISAYPTGDWPNSLAVVPHLSTLFVRGRLKTCPIVAIVGTRSASHIGRRRAATLGASLASAGLSVASGGALGIDAAAHEGALSVGGHTISILPTGLVKPYPARHIALFEDIVAGGGALISEHRKLYPIHRSSFVRRNLIIAALADATVVVEAPARSGALSTARAARRYGKPVFVSDEALGERNLGGQKLLDDDKARPLSQLEDWLREAFALSISTSPKKQNPRVRHYDAPEIRRIIAALTAKPLSAVQLAAYIEMAPKTLARTLAHLELDGVITRQSDGTLLVK